MDEKLRDVHKNRQAGPFYLMNHHKFLSFFEICDSLKRYSKIYLKISGQAEIDKTFEMLLNVNPLKFYLEFHYLCERRKLKVGPDDSVVAFGIREHLVDDLVERCLFFYELLKRIRFVYWGTNLPMSLKSEMLSSIPHMAKSEDAYFFGQDGFIRASFSCLKSENRGEPCSFATRLMLPWIDPTMDPAALLHLEKKFTRKLYDLKKYDSYASFVLFQDLKTRQLLTELGFKIVGLAISEIM